MKTMNKTDIKRAKSAEKVGVSSKVVQDFIDECLDANKELHSVIVIRHGEIASETYRAPFDATKGQMMYSISKSFTSTAVALAIEEGYFSLETKFLDVFPEFRKATPDEYLEKLNVKHLLSMTGGKSVSPFMDRSKDNWLEQIFDSPWYGEPGTSFEYISENMYVLCSIIHKLCGVSVLEFLKPRLFEPLGIEDVRWETCPKGVETGGWGIVIKPMDLAKLMFCYQQKGKYNGEQIIPEYWTTEATKFQVDNSNFSADIDTIQGYGYCFWRCSCDSPAYRSDGMFSQFGVVFEEYDACVIVTSGEIMEQSMRDIIWHHFPRAFEEEYEPVEIEIEPYKEIHSEIRSSLEKEISSKKYKFIKPITNNLAGFPVSIITLPGTFMEVDRAGNIDEVTFEFYEDDMRMTWAEGDEVNSIMIGLDGQYRIDNIIIGQLPHETYSTARWNSDNELEIHVRAIDVTAMRVLVFKFDGKKILMTPSSIPEGRVMLEGLEESIKAIIKQPVVQNLVTKALPKMSKIIVDVAQRGKMV